MDKKLITVKITSRKHAKRVATGWADKIITLADPMLEFKDVNIEGIPQHIEWFDDIEHDILPLTSKGRIIYRFQPPTIEQVKRILDFSDKFLFGDNVIVHCEAGVSRSTAVAILIQIQCGFSAQDAFNRVERNRPQLWPNMLVLEHGIKVLGVDDEILDIVDEFTHKNARRFFINGEWERI